MTVEPPGSEAELVRRGRELAGCSLGEVADRLGAVVPENQRRAKGWVGVLVEKALGATAQSRSEPDFPELGIELKTLPIGVSGEPRESTFVCTIELNRIPEIEWGESRVKKKLDRVLWFPVQAAPEIPMRDRCLGEPLLWSPAADEESALRFDWEELAGIIGRGDVETITGHIGRCLQIRPKARDSHARRRGVDVDGARFAALPRGFYLRATFTSEILRQNYAL